VHRIPQGKLDQLSVDKWRKEVAWQGRLEVIQITKRGNETKLKPRLGAPETTLGTSLASMVEAAELARRQRPQYHHRSTSEGSLFSVPARQFAQRPRVRKAETNIHDTGNVCADVHVAKSAITVRLVDERTTEEFANAPVEVTPLTALSAIGIANPLRIIGTGLSFSCSSA
jgi:hypothetical protein